MSVTSSELGPSTPLSRKRVCPAPSRAIVCVCGGGGCIVHTPLRVRERGSPNFGRLEEKLSTLSTLWSGLRTFLPDGRSSWLIHYTIYCSMHRLYSFCHCSKRLKLLKKCTKRNFLIHLCIQTDIIYVSDFCCCTLTEVRNLKTKIFFFYL